jgi:hypothetical protein
MIILIILYSMDNVILIFYNIFLCLDSNFIWTVIQFIY